MTEIVVNPASYRDPAGFVFEHDGGVFRKINSVYATSYDRLMQSGLYSFLTQKGWLIEHQETDQHFGFTTDRYKILSLPRLSFLSYSYEWSFDMLRDAALLTLDINMGALEHGMILKDATPFNVQFRQGKPVFIDTLSFEIYDPSKPWVAYRQFCEMFLFPLYLEHYLDTDIKKMLSAYVDGIPVDLMAKWLPVRSRFRLDAWLHVYLQNVVGRKSQKEQTTVFDRSKMQRMIEHLRQSISGLKRNRDASTWSNYYQETILSKKYLAEKEILLRLFLTDISYHRALDVGANDGYFSTVLAERGGEVIAIDADSPCINRLYLKIKKENRENILPLVVDISNPSPAVGLNNTERLSFLQRAGCDMVLALALVHHLVLAANIKPSLLPALFAQLASKWLIIEFIPPEDPRVLELVQHKKNFHAPPDAATFENEFSDWFAIKRKAAIPGSSRILYLMSRKS